VLGGGEEERKKERKKLLVEYSSGDEDLKWGGGVFDRAATSEETFVASSAHLPSAPCCSLR
jgi:hypothetical protein